MTGTNCDLFTHKSSRSYLNHLVYESLSLLKAFKGRNTKRHEELTSQDYFIMHG
jgi:hypothetical protein